MVLVYLKQQELDMVVQEVVHELDKLVVYNMDQRQVHNIEYVILLDMKELFVPTMEQ